MVVVLYVVLVVVEVELWLVVLNEPLIEPYTGSFISPVTLEDPVAATVALSPETSPETDAAAAGVAVGSTHTLTPD